MKLFRKFQPGFVRGLLCLSVLLGICAMLFPLPIASPPQKSTEKDSSERFPCQNRPCGCRSAEQCWKKCCCFNNAQKVAWAEANKVKVPDFVLAAAKIESGAGVEVCLHSGSNKESAAAKQRSSSSPCEQKPVAEKSTSCCDKQKTHADAKPHSCESCSSSAEKSPEFRRKSASSKWVLAVYAAECQGQGPPAFCFPVSIIPDRPRLVTLSVEVIETFVFESERLLQASLRPPLPPPKIV
jgi:hypothetical protein